MVGMARDLRAPCGRAGISALSKWLPCPPLDQPCVWSQGTVANKPSRPCPPGGRRSTTPSAGLFPARHGAPRAGPGRLVPCKVKWEPGPGSPRCSRAHPEAPRHLILLTTCFLAAAARRKTSEAGQERHRTQERALRALALGPGSSRPLPRRSRACRHHRGGTEVGGMLALRGKPGSLLSNSTRPLCFSASSKVAKDQGPGLKQQKGNSLQARIWRPEEVLMALLGRELGRGLSTDPTPFSTCSGLGWASHPPLRRHPPGAAPPL